MLSAVSYISSLKTSKQLQNFSELMSRWHANWTRKRNTHTNYPAGAFSSWKSLASAPFFLNENGAGSEKLSSLPRFHIRLYVSIALPFSLASCLAPTHSENMKNAGKTKPCQGQSTRHGQQTAELHFVVVLALFSALCHTPCHSPFVLK